MMRRFLMMIIAVWMLSGMTAATAADISTRIFSNYTAADGLADNSAQTIRCTKTGRLVISTAGQINFFNGAKFSYIDPLDENIYPLSEYNGNFHLYFDRYHHMWLKNTHSVTCVELITERFVASIEDEFRKFGVDEKVNDLFVDSAGVAWLLTNNGLYNVKSQLTIKPHARLNLQDLEVCKDKYVMLFYNNGLMEMFDQKTGKKVHETRAYNDADAERYGESSLLTLAKNKVFQIRNGKKEAVLLSYDLKKNTWAEVLRTPYHLNSMELNDSMLYVPCEYGYWTVNINGGEPRHIESILLDNGMSLTTDINVIAFDRQGGMWAGTETRGLLYARPFTAPFKAYPWGNPIADRYGAMMDHVDQRPVFRDRTVNCVYKDSRGWTWVGTPQGLQVYRKESDMLPQVYTTKDGLYNNIVHSIVEDQKHNIWVATSYGISVVLFNADNRVQFINSYNQYDNIPNEVFVNGKAMCMPDGSIVMQALDHVVEFNPNNMNTLRNKYPFKIYPKLVQLMVNGINVNTNTEINGRKILDRALSRIWGLDLNYNENSLTLVFSALNYFRPQQTYYRVRVLGLDDEWRVLAPHNSGGMVDRLGLLYLPLMSLRPGHYEVEVQTSMSPDDWDTRPYVWTIDINEPWWRTTGVFVLFGILITVLFLINIFYYMKNANLRAQRDSDESMLIKRIYNFVERCENSSEILEPAAEEYSAAADEAMSELDPKFVKAMDKVKLLVMSEKKKKMTMRRLSSVAGISGKEFYQLVTANIFKSPRVLIKKARLEEGEKLLRNTRMTIDEIAEKCGFISANYFIASFFQKNRVTPHQYREKR